MTSSSLPDNSATEASLGTEPGGEIVARAARYYRWTRYLIAVGLMMGYGSLFIKDGFFTWPAERRSAIELESQNRKPLVKPHTELDITVNRIIGLTVPPLGLSLLIWTLYNSRGEYRFDGHVLHVPGHPPVPIEAIREIDKTLWDKKGIAYVTYELSAAASGETAARRLKLDDFVYQQAQTDDIMKRIEGLVAPPDETGVEDAMVEREGAQE